MNIIPKINGPITWTGEEATFTLPLAYEGDCPFDDQFPLTANGVPVLHLTQDASLAPEAYHISIQPNSITLAAAAKAGTYYGLQTLCRLLQEGQGKLPCGELSDAPRYEHRGLSFDVVRHFFGADEVKKILAQCAKLKINRFHWHLSDDQGFRIESKRYPLLNGQQQNRGYYTQEEIRDIVCFAAEHQIEIIPEIDLPGHTRAIIAAYPQYSCTEEPTVPAAKGGIYREILCAGKEEVYEFLFDLLDEVSELFPGPYFHIGGDEAPKKNWKACPHCQAKIKAEGLKDEEELQAHFTKRLIDFLKTKGKTVIAWNEAAASGTLDDSAIVQYWMDMGRGYCAEEAKKGRKFIYSKFTSFYLDYPHNMVSLKAMYESEPITLRGDVLPEEQVLGLEAALWTERYSTNEQIERKLFPRLLALAENAWTNQKDYHDFVKRAKAQETYWQQDGFAYTLMEDADLDGKKGLKRLKDMPGKLLIRMVLSWMRKSK